MAKAQTFGDKAKKKKQADTGIPVKVIKGFRNEKGSMSYVERFVNVKELSELEKVDVTK